jgi:small subunit ribosomal protein S8
MSVNNTLSDFCSRIKNSSRSRVENVLIIKSKKVIKVLDILLLEGFIKGFSFDTLDKNKMKVTLKYSNNGDPIVKTIKAISKSGKRVYSSVSSLWSVQSHFSDGCVILSTSKGVMSLNQALKNNLGGELLCYVA